MLGAEYLVYTHSLYMRCTNKLLYHARRVCNVWKLSTQAINPNVTIPCTSFHIITSCVYIFIFYFVQAHPEVEKVTKPNGELWCYHASERVVRKKGWAEETTGSGSARSVKDDDFESMCEQLKGSGWEFTLNESEKKQLTRGTMPDKLTIKLNGAHTARVCFVIDSATIMHIHTPK